MLQLKIPQVQPVLATGTPVPCCSAFLLCNSFPSSFPKLWWSTSKRCLKMKYNSVHWLFCENVISLWELKLCLYQAMPWQQSWHYEVESQMPGLPMPSHSHAKVLLSCLASLSFRRSKLQPCWRVWSTEALFRSSQGFLRAGGKQMTAPGWRRAWPEDKVKGCNDLHPEPGAVQQLPFCAWSPGEPLRANLTDFLPTPLRAKLGALWKHLNPPLNTFLFIN